MFLALLGLAGALAAPPTTLEVRHIGNMGFLISDGTTTLAIDFPYQSGAFGYQTWKEAEVPSLSGEVTALFTHRHADHFDAGLLGSRGWMAFGPDDLLSAVPAAKRADLKSLKNRGIAIEPLKTPHGNVGHYSYLIEWKGLRIYHSGDTEDPASLIAAGEVDLALVSAWVLEAAKEKAKARRFLVCHVAPGEVVEVLPESASLAVPGAVLALSSGGLTGPERP
jgi:L-ascorbate metabolism protein UlaG (beta-lactamase superfamily)